MHLPDGILPPAVTLTGYAVSVAVAGFCLYQIRQFPDPRAEVPRTALLTAVFFVASLIAIPLPPISVHLLLNGLLGALLGWFAFPAILVGLALQALMFGHGGVTTIGINGVILGLPALLAFALFRLAGKLPRQFQKLGERVLGFVVGAGAVALSVLLFAGLALSFLPAAIDAERERQALAALMLAYLPVLVLEGLITALLVGFLQKVSPELLHGRASR